MAIKYGFVGSRRRTDKETVEVYVDNLPKDAIVISGGCKGVDTWAEERAKKRHLKTIIFRPNLSNVTGRFDMINRYYERNMLIAKEADIIYAFPADDRKGGTETTIEWAKKYKKSVIIIDVFKNERKESKEKRTENSV